MAGNQLFQEQLRLHSPHTYNALTKLVMAMAAVTKNSGKKTFFGRDKGQQSYSKFLGMLQVTLQSMVLDRVIQESTSSDQVINELLDKIRKFELAHPNWQDAYSFASYFFKENHSEAVAVVERLRGTP
ncbi:hypothetical protein A8C75_10140 [Marinobacterium aestuarii]|uniref:Uncharacterized protein n=1 Tax=Marinobacterium aestuarii TaxID=1821621 RepID=A0A1A9EYU1_9GAMM|nr:hypothetical protein [Marinobacterium aestuarii]ANG62808.1 hypothetical protein A8C75_10140 [Marinobacterium aestuarii]